MPCFFIIVGNRIINGLLASWDYKMEISTALREKASGEKKGLNDIMGEAMNPFQENSVRLKKGSIYCS